MGASKLLGLGFSRSSSTSSSLSSSSSSESLSYGLALMSGRIKEIESIITQSELDASASSSSGSLFGGRRGEARRFFHAVSDLDHYMRYLNTAKLDGWSSGYSPQDEFVRTRRLLEFAMNRLQTEFFSILSADRDRLGLGSESVKSCSSDDDESSPSCSSDVKAGRVHDQLMNLRSIANSMLAAGYTKECVKVYMKVRKSIVEESICGLGFQRLNRSQLEKLNVASVERMIKSWLATAVVVMKTIFARERRLCDSVFESSEKIKESCFAEITRDTAVQFLEFPGLVAAAASSSSKKASKWKRPNLRSASSPVTIRIFHLLDLHNCITDLWPEIEKVFPHNATSSVQAQAIFSLQALGASVEHMLADFETTIHKDVGKELAAPAGELHPLTRRVMDVLAELSDYTPALDDIFYEHLLPAVDPPSSAAPPSVSARFAWLLLVLLSKLDAKAELYKDKSLSYLFLANNFLYVVGKVASAGKLREILGDEWVKKHEDKGRSFMASYQRVGRARKAAAMEEDEI